MERIDNELLMRQPLVPKRRVDVLFRRVTSTTGVGQVFVFEAQVRTIRLSNISERPTFGCSHQNRFFQTVGSRR